MPGVKTIPQTVTPLNVGAGSRLMRECYAPCMRPVSALLVLLALSWGMTHPAMATDPPQGRGQWFPTFTSEWVFETGG
jgi:hypothetical protein